MRTLFLCLSASLLTGCGGSIRSGERALPPCGRPVTIPSGPISDQAVERYWGQDRAALADCRAKVETLSGRGGSDQ